MHASAVLERLPSYLAPFVSLQYPTAVPARTDSFPDSQYYNNGVLDGCLIISLIAVMAVLRDFSRLWILEPFAEWKLTRDLKRQKNAKAALANGNEKTNGFADGYVKATGALKGNGHAVALNGNGHMNGHTVYAGDVPISRKEAKKMHRSVLRFAEQGWSFIYYTTIWCFGLYIHSNLPTRTLDPVDVWIGYPHIPLPAPIKFYYLLETAFYCHQILVINAEARRKDHWQMMTHHVITIALMVGSYFYNYTRVGCLIMLLMDWCDIILPLAKMLRYVALSTLCDVTFVCFMISWAVTRHALFVIAIRSTWDASRLIPSLWDRDHGHFMSKQVYWAFFSMLVALQAIQVLWFWEICRVAWLVVSGSSAEDTRSDEEE